MSAVFVALILSMGATTPSAPQPAKLTVKVVANGHYVPSTILRKRSDGTIVKAIASDGVYVGVACKKDELISAQPHHPHYIEIEWQDCENPLELVTLATNRGVERYAVYTTVAQNNAVLMQAGLADEVDTLRYALIEASNAGDFKEQAILSNQIADLYGGAGEVQTAEIYRDYTLASAFGFLSVGGELEELPAGIGEDDLKAFLEMEGTIDAEATLEEILVEEDAVLESDIETLEGDTLGRD